MEGGTVTQLRGLIPPPWILQTAHCETLRCMCLVSLNYIYLSLLTLLYVLFRYCIYGIIQAGFFHCDMQAPYVGLNASQRLRLIRDGHNVTSDY